MVDDADRERGSAVFHRRGPCSRAGGGNSSVNAPRSGERRGGNRLGELVAGDAAFALLLGYLFDTLGYRRCEWNLNIPSRQAAIRLGFRYEGTFRQAIVIKGRNRDTSWFAVIDPDWPALRAAYDAWLADENLDADDGQRRALSEFMPC